MGFLRALGHDVVRVHNEVMPVTSTDEAIVLKALDDERVVLTQDLRFSAILGRAGQRAPSLISLRLSSSRIEFVNAILERVLPLVERDVAAGAIVTVEDSPDPDAPTAYPVGSYTSTVKAERRVIGPRGAACGRPGTVLTAPIPSATRLHHPRWG